MTHPYFCTLLHCHPYMCFSLQFLVILLCPHFSNYPILNAGCIGRWLIGRLEMYQDYMFYIFFHLWSIQNIITYIVVLSTLWLLKIGAYLHIQCSVDQPSLSLHFGSICLWIIRCLKIFKPRVELDTKNWILKIIIRARLTDGWNYETINQP